MGAAGGRADLAESNANEQFERIVVPHLDAAYNLARWLVGDDQDAQDQVQDACLRAYKALPTFRGGDARSWVLAIVRNVCYTWLGRNKAAKLALEFDEEVHIGEASQSSAEQELIRDVDRGSLRQALEEMPIEFREALVLRELEGQSYKEIADTLRVPLGTVMSRLARGRQWLRRRLVAVSKKEDSNGL